LNINAEVLNSAPLLRVYTGNGIEGSNPFLSASAALKLLDFSGTFWQEARAAK